MRRYLRTRAAAILLFAGSAGGCGPDVVDHPDLLPKPAVPAEGNFPAVIEQCGDLPEGVLPIAGLAAAWVEQAGPGEPIRLVLSDRGVECGADIQPVSTFCESAFAHALTMPEAAITPGAHELGAYPDLCSEIAIARRNGTACAFPVDEGGVFTLSGGTFGGSGGPAPLPWMGVLEIFASDDRCVIGTIRLDSSSFLLPTTGGFVAQRCQVDALAECPY